MSKISIITVTFNCRSAFERTLQSVVEQSDCEVEYIVVDGGSTDGTLDLIVQAAQRGMVSKWVSEADGGIYDAMNKGVAMATGDWVNFLNAGDRFVAPDVLARVARQLPADGGVVYGDHILELPYGDYIFRAPTDVEGLRRGMIFCHQAVFVPTQLMRCEGFDTQYSLSADYDFFYRCLCNGVLFTHVDVVVARYEAIDGASTKHRLRAIHQNGKIRHVDRTLKWLVWYGIQWTKHYAKIIVGRLAPTYAQRAKRRGIECKSFIEKVETK